MDDWGFSIWALLGNGLTLVLLILVMAETVLALLRGAGGRD